MQLVGLATDSGNERKQLGISKTHNQGMAWNPISSHRLGDKVMERSYIVAVLVMIAACAISQPVFAQIQVSGVVGNTQVVGSGGGAPGNYDLRVFFTSNSVMCDGQAWAYINIKDSNYSALVASIMFAKTTGETVVLWGHGSRGVLSVRPDTILSNSRIFLEVIPARSSIDVRAQYSQPPCLRPFAH